MKALLPIEEALPALIDALHHRKRAVLQAPPGAGKTTRVPLALLEANLCTGRILMLEPRRLAARAAAERMAETLGEVPGERVGYRMRGAVKSGPKTRIEVVTEGILTRMIQSDPELSGIDVVIFDEFHERSLNADLGLALCLEIAGALRGDLMLLVMSATLDAAPVATLMGDVPVITSQGRSFPVAFKWLEKPLAKTIRYEAALADLVVRAAEETEGGLLVFLPGEGEIRRVETLLKPRLGTAYSIRPLYGAMPFADQRAAIQPDRKFRKVVLATAIAETSLTLEDICVVVDGGRARRARFDAGSGMSRLVTEKVTRAEATQRAGRAGRVSNGTAYRLWTRGEEGGLQAYPPAEIEAADLAPLALELALWGATAATLPFLTQPNAASLSEAQALLRLLGALDRSGQMTPHGRKIAALPLHPRLAHMLGLAGPQGALLAALLADRDPLARSAPVDLNLRIEALRDLRHYSATRPDAANRGAVERIRHEAHRLERSVKDVKATSMSLPEMAALAYPDRIGYRRPGDAPRFILSGGKGAVLDDHDPLASQRLIVATDLDGNPREARIRQATALSNREMRGLFANQITWANRCDWSKRDRRVIARQQEMLGAAIVDDRIWRDVPEDALARAMLDGVRDLGLSLSPAAQRFVARVALGSKDLPEMTEAALVGSLETWLLPHLQGVKTADDWKRFDLLPALRARLTWPQMSALDRDVPAHFETPLRRHIAIDYGGEHPEIALRLQEMFGQTSHPMVGKTPLRVTLLSPAGRPLQTTMDLPGFWASSYLDVRKDMRGRYPRHPWPEDPTEADPTLRVKRPKTGP
jgi:ATP-dependent helicase HrpB